MAGPWEAFQAQGNGPWAQFAKPPDVNPVSDFAQSIPRGMLSGLVGAVAGAGQSNAAESGMNTEDMPSGAQGMQSLEKNVTGPLYQPQGKAGQVGAAIGETLGNPVSYVGPGSMALKLGGAALSGAGSEIGGQLAQGTALETPARLAGGLAGGVVAGKTIGPTAERAAVPTARELKIEEDRLYAAARNSGVEVAPKGLADFGTQAEQNLTTGPKYAFTGGPDGTAPGTLKLLDKLQNPPEGATVTAANLDTIRRQINDLAGQTKDFKPTSDAKAAMVLKRDFADYLENIPQDHVVAGNPQDFVSAIKEANKTHGALQNTNLVNQKISNAVDNTEGSIAARLDNQIKSQLRPIIKNPKAQRGLTQDEVAATRGVNRGTVPSNVLSQVGRLGAGVIPAMAHVGTAFATGGASIPLQIALASGLYAARKGGEQLTLRQARSLAEQMAKRSPLYQQRLNALPQFNNAPNIAAPVRGLLGGLR